MSCHACRAVSCGRCREGSGGPLLEGVLVQNMRESNKGGAGGRHAGLSHKQQVPVRVCLLACLRSRGGCILTQVQSYQHTHTSTYTNTHVRAHTHRCLVCARQASYAAQGTPRARARHCKLHMYVKFVCMYVRACGVCACMRAFVSVVYTSNIHILASAHTHYNLHMHSMVQKYYA